MRRSRGTSSDGRDRRGTRAGHTRAPAQRKPTDRAKAERRLAYWLCAPAVVVMVASHGLPDRVRDRPPRCSATTCASRPTAAGSALDNYFQVLTASTWWNDVLSTVVITVFSVGIELVLGTLLALVMHRAIFGARRGAGRQS